jgi:acid phosphatase type 7
LLTAISLEERLARSGGLSVADWGSGETLKIKLLVVTACLLLSVNDLRSQETGGVAKSTVQKSPKATARNDASTFTLVGAGDIAWCGNLMGAQATAKLIDKIPGTVFAAGDLAYDRGSYEEFQDCYQPTWGRFRKRTKPAPGIHEYNGLDATGYFQYWGHQAGDPDKGYYSFELGPWHIIALNTNCQVRALDGCGEG